MTFLHSETYGKGRPIVMIHGWGMHSAIWRPFAQLLARRHRVTLIDLPGHGRSAAMPLFDLDHIAPAVLQALPKEPACWLGWSLGATVATDLASRFPEAADSLILLAGNPQFTRTGDSVTDPEHWPGVSPRVLEAFAGQLTADAQQTLLRFLGLQVHGLADAKECLKILKAAIFECESPPRQTLLQGLQILNEADLRPALAELQKPVMAIFGDRDTLVPHAVSSHLCGLQPAIRYHVIEKAGHVPFLTHPHLLCDLINDFLA